MGMGMKKGSYFRGLLATAVLALATPAYAGFILTTDILAPTPASNAFVADLPSHFSTGANQVIDISGSGTIEFFFEGKEASFTNSFLSSIAGINFQQVADDLSFNNGTVSIGSGSFNVGDLMNDLLFDSVEGVNNAGIANVAFGFFVAGPGALSGVDVGNVLYLGFDDQNVLQDDNHDDLVIKAVFTPVPEPMISFLLVSALVGLGRRRQ